MQDFRMLPSWRRLAAAVSTSLPLALMLLASSGCAPTAHDLGVRALDQGDATAAMARFDEALAAGEDPFPVLRDRGAARLELGDPRGALADLEQARQLNDADARLYWLLGQANAADGNVDAASAAYRRYQMMVSDRAVKRLAAQRVAQLRLEAAQATAANLQEARRLGVPAPDNTVALFAFRPYDQQDPSEDDLRICRALSVWVTADLQKVAALRPVAADAMELYYEAQGTSRSDRWQLDPASLVESGKLQPARHMVRGEFGSVGKDRVVMLGVMVDAERQQVADFPVQEDRVEALFDMETQFVFDLLDRMGIEPTPEERLAIGEKPTRNPKAFMAYADGLYRLWDLGDPEGAQASFEAALSLDPGFAMAGDGLLEASAVKSGDATVVVPAPVAVKTSTERAMASAGHLGMGLVPDSDVGEASGVETQPTVITRGSATVRVRAEITP